MHQHKDVYSRSMRHPYWTIVLLLVAAIACLFQIPDLQLDASSDSLVLQGDKSLVTYHQIQKEYGSADFLFVAYQTRQDFFAEPMLKKMAALKADLQKINGVKKVVTYLDLPLIYTSNVKISSFARDVHYVNDGKVDKTLARKEFFSNPLYKQLFFSVDMKTTAVQIILEPEAKLRAPEKARKQPEKQIVQEVRSVLEKYRGDARIFLGGAPMVLSDMLDFVQRDMIVFGVLIGMFIMVVLTLIFHSWRWLVLPLATCLLTCIYILGGIAWLDMKLTIVSANFIPLLLIIGLSVTLHLAVNFSEYEIRFQHLEYFDVVMSAAKNMFKPCMYAALTTIIAFLSLVASGIQPINDFGWIMTVAVAVVLVVAFLLIPAGLLILPRRKHLQTTEAGKGKGMRRQDWVTRHLTHALAIVTAKYGKAILFLSMMVFIGSCAGILHLKVENRFINYFDKDTEIYQGMMLLDRELGGTMPLDILLSHGAENPEIEDMNDDFASSSSVSYIPSYWFSRKGMEEINKVHQYLEQREESGKVLSLATLYKVLVDVTGGNIDDVQLAMFRQKSTPDINAALVKPYLSEDGRQTRVTVRLRESGANLNRGELIDNLKTFLMNDLGYTPGQIKISGLVVLYNNVLESLFATQIVSLGMVFLLITLMFVSLFRSTSLAMIAIAPNILAAMVVLGGMGWLGVPLDVMTITVASITVGIGADNSVHYVHRFKQEFAKDRDYLASMQRSHASIGLAMVYSSVVIIAGFSILTLSDFIPTVYFGCLTGVAMLVALVGALTLLPQLIITFKPFGRS